MQALSVLIPKIAEYFHSGGLFMWGVLFALGFAIAVVTERIVYYFIICRVDGKKIVFKVKKALNENKIEEAQQIVAKSMNPVSRMVKVILEHYKQNSTIEKIQDDIEEISIVEVPKMSKRLNYLTLIANITTLLGLLGTITGLQKCFSSLGNVDAAQKAALLANGISEALNTTAFGLGVAIICMILFTSLTNKKQALLQDMDQSIVRLVNFIKEKKT